MEQENWINSILNSADGITKVEPDDALLLFRIKERINAKNVISLRQTWAVAASFAVLFILNFAIIYSQSKKSEDKTEMIASYLSKTNQLY
ncbi:MAG: hypothetical protein ABI426_05815 [Flavobacterium sp.]